MFEAQLDPSTWPRQINKGNIYVDQSIEDCSLPKRLEKFIDDFIALHRNEALFPKGCRSCGEEFRTLSEYLCLTVPKGHVFEDYSKIMKKPYTMVYRHCICGNTLVLVTHGRCFSRFKQVLVKHEGCCRRKRYPIERRS